jgi:cytochrome P450
MKKRYPQTGIFDLFGLLGRVIGALIRRRNLGETFVAWLRHLTKRYQSPNLILNLLVRKILLVSGQDLSIHVLAGPPSSRHYVEGTLKKKAMTFLAPHALTISHDEQWQTLRSYNEQVLGAGAPHVHRQAFLAHVRRAFARPVVNIDEIRQRMGQVMLAVVFGEGNAPDHLIDDIQTLFAEVSPRTAFLGSKKTEQRDAFQRLVQDLWRTGAGADQPSLLALAHAVEPQVEAPYRREEILVQQIPHWMFTFTNSGSDLLGRSLAMITARPESLQRVRQEIAAAGPLDQAETIDKLSYLAACILETGRLYPPVTQTVHRAASQDEFNGVDIPADTELLQLFPLTNRDTSLDALANHFHPERWLDPDDAVHRNYPNLFLSGARACPGQDLILFIDKAALAILIQNQTFQPKSTLLSSDPLPFSFPAK